MARGRRPDETKKGLDIWVMTYGDMMSLLLVFFILIVSFSSIQESKFRDAMISVQSAFGVESFPPTVLRLPQVIVPERPGRPTPEVTAAVEKLERSLLVAGLDQDVDVKVTEKGVALRIKAPMLFASGRAELRAEGVAVLDTVAGFLVKFGRPVRIEGHTDTVPINTVQFPSNWELSAARAIAVARHLVTRGLPPERVIAAGHGEHKPIADNATAAGRELNRRVEIFLELKPAGATGVTYGESEAIQHGR